MNTLSALADSVGIVLNEPLADGKIHYVKTIDDKPGKSSGRYVIRPQENNLVFAWLMNHKNGKQVKQWINDKLLKDKYKSVDRAAQKIADDLDDEIKQKTIKQKWESSLVAPSNHQYLQSKQIQKHCARADKQGRLVIPVRDVLTGNLVGLQYISPSGSKKFEPGTKQKGNAILIWPPGIKTDYVFICEGFATGVSLHNAIGNKESIYCALSCSNLLPVVKRLKTMLRPYAQIIICADNDQFTEGNPGIKHAIQAANEVGCKFIYPEFKEEHLIQRPTDFNDFARLYGKEELRRFINERIN